MFLSKINLSKSKAELFVNLATLLVTAESRDGDSRKILTNLKVLDSDFLGEERGDNWFVPSVEEVEALKICMQELGAFRYVPEKLGIYKSLFKGIFSEGDDRFLLNSFFKRDYIDSLKVIVSDLSSDPDCKKQVLNNFIELGVDLSEIDQVKIEKAITQLPQVRKLLIENILEQIFSKADLNELSLTERKIFLFELASLAHADGSVHELEELVVKVISDNFGFDEDTLDELKDASKEVISAVNDAAEVIFE